MVMAMQALDDRRLRRIVVMPGMIMVVVPVIMAMAVVMIAVRTMLMLGRRLFGHRAGRLEFVPVRVAARDQRGVPLLEKLGRGGSARLWPLIVADGLACIPAAEDDLPPNAPIDYFPFDTAFKL